MNSINGAQDYPILWGYMEGLPGTDEQKNQAIEVCLRDPTFVGRMEKTKARHVEWVKQQLQEKLAHFAPKNKSKKTIWIIAAGITAILASAALIGHSSQTKKQSKIPKDTPRKSMPAQSLSNFSESAASSPVVAPYPQKPYNINDLPGITLDEKIKNFIKKLADAGDPTMKKILEHIQMPESDIRFMNMAEAIKILGGTEKIGEQGWNNFGATVIEVVPEERKDGIKKPLGLIILPEIGLMQTEGVHILAGVIANEMMGLQIKFTNSDPIPEGQISFDGKNYRIPNWVHESAGVYTLQECISSIVDEIVVTRTATDNPEYYPDSDKLWSSICEHLKNGTFSKNFPDNYARFYFAIGFKKMGLPDELITEPSFQRTLEAEYQRGVEFATRDNFKAGVMNALRTVGAIK